MRPQKRLDLLVIASMLFCGTALSFSDLGLDRLFNDVLEAVDDSAGMVISEEAVIEEVIQEEPVPEEEVVVEDAEVVEEPVSEEDAVVEDAEVVEEPVTEEEAVVDDAEVVEESVTEEEAVVEAEPEFLEQGEEVDQVETGNGPKIEQENDISGEKDQTAQTNKGDSKKESKQDVLAEVKKTIKPEAVVKVIEKQVEETAENRVFTDEEKLEEVRLKKVYADRDEAIRLFLFDYYLSGQFVKDFEALDTKLYYFDPSMIDQAFQEDFFGHYEDLLNFNLNQDDLAKVLKSNVFAADYQKKKKYGLIKSPLLQRVADLGSFYQRRLAIRGLDLSHSKLEVNGSMRSIFASVIDAAPENEVIEEPAEEVVVEEEAEEPEEPAEEVVVEEEAEEPEEPAEEVAVEEEAEELEEVAEEVVVEEEAEEPEEAAEEVVVEEEGEEPEEATEEVVVEEEGEEPEEATEEVVVEEPKIVEKVEYIDSDQIVAPNVSKSDLNGGYYLINESFKIREFNDVYYLELLFPKDFDFTSMNNFTFHLEDEIERNYWPDTVFVTGRQALLVFKKPEILNANLLFVRNLKSMDGDNLNGYFSLQVEGDRYTELVKNTKAAYSAYVGDDIQFSVDKLTFANLHSLVQSNSTIAVEIGNASNLSDQCAILVFGNNLQHESGQDQISIKGLKLLSRSSGALPVSKPVVDAFKREKSKEFLGFVYFNELEVKNGSSLLYLNLSASGGLEKGRYQADMSFEIFCP